MEPPIVLLAEALKSHGLEVKEAVSPVISGFWNGEDTHIFVYSGEEEKERLFSFLDDRDGNRALACLIDVEEGVQMAIEREGVVLWTRKEVEAILGRHVLLVKSGLRLQEPLFTKKEKGQSQEIFVAPLDLKSEQIISPKVTRAEAEHKAARVGGFDFNQVLVPHYLFRYRCTLQTTGGEEQKKQGFIWIDSVSGEQREINTQFSAVDDMDSPHFKMEPEVEIPDATDLALEGIVALNTRELEEVRHTGTATIFEKQKTFPVQESIETELVGLLYLPMWNIEGSRGSMTINAVTGDVVAEQSYSSLD